MVRCIDTKPRTVMAVVLVVVLAFVLYSVTTSSDSLTSHLYQSQAQTFKMAENTMSIEINEFPSHIEQVARNNSQVGEPDSPLFTAPSKHQENSSDEAWNHYVALSTTLSTHARLEDYDFLAPLTAINWRLHGFRPILLVCASSQSQIDSVRKLWDIVLPRETIVVPVIVPFESLVIPVAQVARLYAAHFVPELPGGAFLRTTDADMFILKSTPFLAPPNNVDIDLYYGHCCLSNNTRHDGRTCNQYSMHSVGMKIELWRKLFNSSREPSVLSYILSPCKAVLWARRSICFTWFEELVYGSNRAWMHR